MFSTRFISATHEYTSFHQFVPAPYFRRRFTLTQEVKSAHITICGLGFYELFINGTRITKGYLAPYIANPDDILYYDTYDVAPHLQTGENVIGVMLGNGMLNCPGGQIWDFETARYRSAPMLALAFEAAFESGEALSFEADETFRCAPSPIYFDDLRAGEFYDARREIPGWNLPGFDDSAWQAAIPVQAPRGECRICEAEPIVISKELAPVFIRRASIGIQPQFRDKLPVISPEGDEAPLEGWLYDFGVNHVGLCRLKIKGRAGQKIILQFGETLDANGNLDLRGMNLLPQAFNHRDIYICKGEGEEIYVPTFTYHGFQYCLVIGLDDAQAVPEALTYLVMHSDIRSIGGFASSCDVLNRIQEAVRVSDLANFYYFPTDCPQREKNGWTADAALSCEQTLLNFTPERSYREWMHNIRKSQREDGAIPGIIPTSGWGFAWGNGPAWDGVLTTLPYFVWRYRGDTTMIQENAATLMRYLHYITTQRDADGLIHIGLGDWCHSARIGSPKAPLEVTDTLMCMDISKKSALMFDAVHMDMQRDFAQRVYDSFRAAARKHLIDFGTMTVRGCCQATQAMGIFYDLFEESEKRAAFDVLLDLIDENNGLMDVGVLGARVIFRVLSQFGRTDLAYEMITTDRFPSYGFWMKEGATSLWERFLPRSANPDSHNHHFWGDVSGWMIECLAGIQVNPRLTDANDLLILPRIIPALHHAEGFTEIPAGRVLSRWAREGEDVLLTLEIPEGAHGRIELERAWQFEDGLRSKPLASGTYRLISGGKKDIRCHKEN